MTAREVIREALILNATRSVTTKTNAILDALTSAGIRFAGPDDRILGPDETDRPTVEKCAAEVKLLRQLLHSQTITLDVGAEDMAYFLAEDAIRALQEKRT